MKAKPRKVTEDAEKLREELAQRKPAKPRSGQVSDQELENVSGGGSGGEDRVSLDIRSIRR